MADATLYTAKGTNDPVVHPSQNINDYLVIRNLVGTAYVGDLVGAVGETFPAVDQLADNETLKHVGMIVGPVIRPSDTWTADTILGAATDAWVLLPGSGSKVWLLINGQDTPVAGVDGQAVFSTSTDGSSTDSRDGSATLNVTQGFGALIGRLAGSFTTGDSTSAANGTYAEVYY